MSTEEVAPEADRPIRWSSLLERAEGWSKPIPLLALGAGIAYAVGLLVCWIADNQFGVGLTGVPKERAIAAGVVCLVGALPTAIGCACCTEYKSRVFWHNLGVLLSACFFVLLVAAGIAAVTGVLGYGMSEAGTNAGPMVVTLASPPILLNLALCAKSIAGTDKHYVMPMSVFTFVSYVVFFGAYGVSSLGAPVGGYSNQQVQVKTTDGRTIEAMLLTSDGSSILLETKTEVIRLSSSSVVEVRGTKPLPKANGGQ